MTKHKTALEKFEDFFKAFEKTYFNSENMHFNVCKFKELADAAIEEAKKDNQVLTAYENPTKSNEIG